MPGETDLAALLRAMEPRLHDVPYVFAVVNAGEFARLPFTPRGTFREDEGITIIAAQSDADAAGLSYDGQWACITLTVHSSLSAVGFIAALSARLASAGLSVNPVSAYYHDHLFVPWERRDEAMAALGTFRA